jgi:transcriptional regulator with XRE-family HTH domain
MTTDLAHWLKGRIDSRGWSLRETARRADLSPTPIASILSGDGNPGLDVYKGLARAFALPLEQVLRAAGELPPVAPGDDADPLFQEGTFLLSQLPPGDLATAVRFLRGLHLTARQDQEATVMAEIEQIFDEPGREDAGSAPTGAEVGRLRRLLASALVSMLNHMHPDDVRAVYDHIKEVRDDLEADRTGAGAIDSAPT